MSEGGSWLHVRAAGLDLLLATQDLREVVAPTAISPLPGRPRGIQGVVIHQGEFLPVLAWTDLPGCGAALEPAVALAVLRPRLGVPLERMYGTVELPPEALLEADEQDPTAAWLVGQTRLNGVVVRVVDVDRLVSLLRRFREDR